MIRAVSSLFRRRYVFLTIALAAACLSGAGAGEVKVLPDLAYKSGGELSRYETERCKLDLYLPEGVKDFPTLVWLHGGGITGGSKDGKETVATGKNFAASGVALANVNYRLSPKSKYPTYIQDTAAAFAWVKKHIADHGGNPDRVFLGGHSAGGYLTLMAGLDDTYLKDQGLKLSDIAGLLPVAGQTLTHFTIRQERGLPKDQIIADDAAPLHHARKDAPPMLILYAEKDMALRAEENQLLAAAMRQAGHTQTAIHLIQGSNHGSVGHNLANPEDEGFKLALQFITSGQP